MNALPSVFTVPKKRNVNDDNVLLKAERAGYASTPTARSEISDFISFVLTNKEPVGLADFKVNHTVDFDDDLVCEFIFNTKLQVQPEWRPAHGIKYFKV